MWIAHHSWAWTPHISLLQGCPPHPTWALIPVILVTKSLFSTLLGLQHPTPHQATPQHGHCPLPAWALPPWARQALLGDGLPLPLELQPPRLGCTSWWNHFLPTWLSTLHTYFPCPLYRRPLQPARALTPDALVWTISTLLGFSVIAALPDTHIPRMPALLHCIQWI